MVTDMAPRPKAADPLRQRIRFAIAEDQELVREALRLYLCTFPDLEFAGEARDGIEALRLVQASKPDVLLLDISMPHLSGLQVVRQLRRSTIRVRVVMLSSYAWHEWGHGLAGVSAYLRKGCHPEKIVDAIRAAVSTPPLGHAANDARFR